MKTKKVSQLSEVDPVLDTDEVLVARGNELFKATVENWPFDSETFATRVSLGNFETEAVSLFATKVSLGNFETEAVSLFATKVSLGNFETEAVSLFSTKVSVSALDTKLVSVYATKTSLGSSKSALEALIDLRAVTDDPTFTTKITTPEVTSGSSHLKIGSDTNDLFVFLATGGTTAETLQITRRSSGDVKYTANGGTGAHEFTGDVKMADLPTSDPQVEGALWNDLSDDIMNGTLKVSSGCVQAPSYVLPSSGNDGHPDNYTYAEEDRPLVVSLSTQTINGVELTEGKAFKIKKYNTSTTSADLVTVDGDNIGWSGNRGVKWEILQCG
jgi:hypothetical protein